ncbi:adenosylcobinamide amidohydrolase [Austwickia chelonae]|uniref:adenosylcobinamide amidohydrolase n=1 Tax=Austwickia chelonae TaxID=100225 RepID=UPI000E26A772|nr:adenosylcobinamide amidohydrolase [Austwickia chelonae]
MRLFSWPGIVAVEGHDRVILARFERPVRVLSTCPRHGGMREDLVALYNHQSCEPAGHGGEVMSYLATHQRAEHDRLCASHGVDPDLTASLGTAASMRCAGVATRSFDDLRVTAVCTAGVEGNAGRAGDPASVVEVDGRYDRVAEHQQPEHGTINTMVFVNHELTSGATARALMNATEAKSAVLQDLVVGSRYSCGRATGTGTDQYALACPIGVGTPLHSAGHHVVLGELVSQAVAGALRDALVLQNGLEPSSRRSVSAQLARFGVTLPLLVERAQQDLAPREAALLAENIRCLDADPLVVAAVAGLAEVVDQVTAGILPASRAQEYAAWGGALIAAAVAAGEANVQELRSQLEGEDLAPDSLVPKAFAVGYALKWRSLHSRLSG